jgi:hypothetical protein
MTSCPFCDLYYCHCHWCGTLRLPGHATPEPFRWRPSEMAVLPVDARARHDRLADDSRAKVRYLRARP